MKITHLGRRALLFFASLLFAVYVLAPIGWLVSSSFQSEAEITSVPPHWIPHQPTFENFATIFTAKDKVVTYENRKEGDTATGGFIPSTAKNLLPSMWNSLIVAVSVVILNLLVSVPAAYALAKIRFIGRDSSIYFMLTTRVIPDIALVVPFFLFVQQLGLLDSLLSLIITYLAITVPFSTFILTGYFESLPMTWTRRHGWTVVPGCRPCCWCTCLWHCPPWWRWCCLPSSPAGTSFCWR